MDQTLVDLGHYLVGGSILKEYSILKGMEMDIAIFGMRLMVEELSTKALESTEARILIQISVTPSAVSKTNLLPPRLTQHRLEAFMAAVSGPIKEAHVIILH